MANFTSGFSISIAMASILKQYPWEKRKATLSFREIEIERAARLQSDFTVVTWSFSFIGWAEKIAEKHSCDPKVSCQMCVWDEIFAKARAVLWSFCAKMMNHRRFLLSAYWESDSKKMGFFALKLNGVGAVRSFEVTNLLLKQLFLMLNFSIKTTNTFE